ncbi:hypothetical protein Btru_073881 [Bulinus truncatus]|nr:hypothetical protein Btru_073881 [Bulinus truncatus]
MYSYERRIWSSLGQLNPAWDNFPDSASERKLNKEIMGLGTEDELLPVGWLPDNNIFFTVLTFIFWFLVFAYFLIVWDVTPAPSRQGSVVCTVKSTQSCLICESVEWFNYLVRTWWTFARLSTEKLVCSSLNQALSKNLPPFIDSFEVNHFTLGNDPPVIRNLRIYESYLATLINFHKQDVRTHEMCVELDLGLANEDFTLILSGRGPPRIVCLMLQRLYFEGTVRCVLTLDKDVPFPHASKARISFTDKPYFKFNICVLGVVNLMQIPLLKTWIHSTIMTQLTAAMVEPASIELNLTEDKGSSYID